MKERLRRLNDSDAFVIGLLFAASVTLIGGLIWWQFWNILEVLL